MVHFISRKSVLRTELSILEGQKVGIKGQALEMPTF